MSVPAEWELVGIPKEHDPGEGYLRLDGRTGPRLEIKWRSHPQRKFDIEKTLDNYIKGIKKEYEKEVGPIEVRRDQAIVRRVPEYEGFFENREVAFFSWRGGMRAFGVIWRCEQCRRVVMAQVLGGPGEQSHRQTALRVLSELEDHPTGEDNLWTAYGLRMQVPRRYRLRKLRLLNGYSLFSFSDGSRDVAVERYGLADQQLRSQTLEDWYRKTYRKSLRGIYFVLDGEDSGPKVLRVEGRVRRTVDVVDRWNMGVSRALDNAFRRTRMAARAWHEIGANRINVVRVHGKEAVEDVVSDVAKSIGYREESGEGGESA